MLCHTRMGGPKY